MSVRFSSTSTATRTGAASVRAAVARASAIATIALTLVFPLRSEAAVRVAVPPAIDLTSSLISSGGGAGSFSMVRAFGNMLGSNAMSSELASLNARYGSRETAQFVRTFDFAISDAWRRFGSDNMAVSQTGERSGRQLASGLVRSGLDTRGAFQIDQLLDATLSPTVRGQVEADIRSRYGADGQSTFRLVADRFFFDLAQRLGQNDVSLASQPQR